MPRTILCTIGTSIAGGTAELARFQKQGSAWADDSAQLRGEIKERLKRFDLTLPKGRIEASAELNSLQRIGLEPDDEIVLLATDTADGRACAETLASVIQQVWPEVRAVVERIAGLQVRDAKRLRDAGLSRLLQVVLRYVTDPQRHHSGGVILNPTGGFKGVVPFLTVVGMLFRVPTVYVFEFAETLIHLPPLPINFDLQLFLRARLAMAALRQRHGGVMNEEEFYRLIPSFQEEERTRFQSLLEVDGHLATLSPLAEVLAKIEETERKMIQLSPETKTDLDGLPGQDRARLESVLSRLANPLWRISHSHSFKRCELAVFGESQFPFRIAAWLKGAEVYVCRILRVTAHDEYEEEFAKLRRRDFEDTSVFTTWTPTKTEDELDLAEVDELEQLRGEVAALRIENRSLEKSLQAEQERNERLVRSQQKHGRDAHATTGSRTARLATPSQVGRAKTGAVHVAPDSDRKPSVPPTKGTEHKAKYVRDDFHLSGGQVWVFELPFKGRTWQGTIKANTANPPVSIGETLWVRINGNGNNVLDLALLAKAR